MFLKHSFAPKFHNKLLSGAKLVDHGWRVFFLQLVKSQTYTENLQSSEVKNLCGSLARHLLTDSPNLLTTEFTTNSRKISKEDLTTVEFSWFSLKTEKNTSKSNRVLVVYWTDCGHFLFSSKKLNGWRIRLLNALFVFLIFTLGCKWQSGAICIRVGVRIVSHKNTWTEWVFLALIKLLAS